MYREYWIFPDRRNSHQQCITRWIRATLDRVRTRQISKGPSSKHVSRPSIRFKSQGWNRNKPFVRHIFSSPDCDASFKKKRLPIPLNDTERVLYRTALSSVLSSTQATGSFFHTKRARAITAEITNERRATPRIPLSMLHSSMLRSLPFFVC